MRHIAQITLGLLVTFLHLDMNCRAEPDPAEPPLNWEASLLIDAFREMGGGSSSGGTVMGLADIGVEGKVLKQGRWFLNIQGFNNSGENLSDISGELQALSNIETHPTLKLYQAWYEHEWRSGQIKLLIGLHDLNADFDVLEYGGLFLNSSLGIQPTLAQEGPSIFPSTSLAARLTWEMTDKFYTKFGLYDGVSGDPGDDHGTHIILKDSDGALIIGESGYQKNNPEEPNYTKIALGAWGHTRNDTLNSGESIGHKSGLYMLAEKQMIHWEPGRYVGLLGQFSVTGPSTGRIQRYIGMGVSLTGITEPGRDILGLALASATRGHQWSTVPGSEGTLTETVVELTYQYSANNYWTLQPDFQWVKNPGVDTPLASTWVAGMRVEYSF